MQKPEEIIQIESHDHSLSFPFNSIIPALVLLLHKYSNYVSEIINIEICCKGVNIDTKILLSKAISSKRIWIDFQEEIHKDLTTLLYPVSFSEIRYLEMNWITDNDEPGTEYKIKISRTDENNYTTHFHASERAFYGKVFRNAIIHLNSLLSDVGMNPSKSTHEIDYLGVNEKERLKTFNYGDINEEVAKPELLHSLFEQTTVRFPNNIAVLGASGSLSYAELNCKANALAEILIGKGIKPNDFVGILLKRSPEVYISMLAILKSGAAYVPLDVGYPEDRISYILSDCGVKLLITNRISYSKPLELSCEVISFDEHLHDSLKKEKQSEASMVDISFTSPAYVIYTSGSTGRPKGVVIPHLSISNLVKAEEQLFKVGLQDRVMQGFSVAFDASVEEIWLALRSGATLIPASEDIMHSGSDLSGFIKEKNISVVSTVPTMLSMMQGPLPSLHLLILGGEYCPHELIQRWHHNQLRIVNTYGPTEATVIATYADFDSNYRITIGKPVI
ncbi:MAG TPA: AMP-binding protein, partial [Nitrosopumilaceae archaeon]|nr:AMP-binding protein [Nitrosopumilaceae archaeon]